MMMEMKLGMISESPMVGCRPSMPAAKHAGETRHVDAESEIEVAQNAHIDAEHRHGFEVERAGANAQAKPRVIEDEKQGQDDDRDHGHHEYAVAGEEEQFAAQWALQEIRDLILQSLRAPNEAGAVLDDEGEAESQQQAVERIAAIEPADQDALDQQGRFMAVKIGDTISAPQKPI